MVVFQYTYPPFHLQSPHWHGSTASLLKPMDLALSHQRQGVWKPYQLNRTLNKQLDELVHIRHILKGWISRNEDTKSLLITRTLLARNEYSSPWSQRYTHQQDRNWSGSNLKSRLSFKAEKGAEILYQSSGYLGLFNAGLDILPTQSRLKKVGRVSKPMEYLMKIGALIKAFETKDYPTTGRVFGDLVGGSFVQFLTRGRAGHLQVLASAGGAALGGQIGEMIGRLVPQPVQHQAGFTVQPEPSFISICEREQVQYPSMQLALKHHMSHKESHRITQVLSIGREETARAAQAFNASFQSLEIGKKIVKLKDKFAHREFAKVTKLAGSLAGLFVGGIHGVRNGPMMAIAGARVGSQLGEWMSEQASQQWQSVRRDRQWRIFPNYISTLFEKRKQVENKDIIDHKNEASGLNRPPLRHSTQRDRTIPKLDAAQLSRIHAQSQWVFSPQITIQSEASYDQVPDKFVDLLLHRMQQELFPAFANEQLAVRLDASLYDRMETR
ncbi:hypothetical protein [Algicola sagamiensis]|uniref:hypothetical protein n=1 Tax=Algicola sagamiensis TaxID=163869 RepID=UPI00035FED27|nr:hypothetical protein [Algicola sagamiensis]